MEYLSVTTDYADDQGAFAELLEYRSSFYTFKPATTACDVGKDA